MQRSPKLARVLALLGFGTISLLALATSGLTAEPKDRDKLEQAVVDKMLGQEEGRAFEFTASEEREYTQTNVERVSDDGRWAFGTAVIEAPRKEGAYPEGWLFVAKKAGNGWNVGLEGSREFADLADEAPTKVVDDEEKELFTASGEYEFQGIRTRLQLPWKRGIKWKMSSGPHGWSTGHDRPYSSLDLSGRGGKVRSARGGRVYKMCSSNRGWLRVVHRNGYATDYYHLKGNIKRRDGARVKTGSFLGYTGEDVSCGGAAYGPHVHFSVLRYGKRISLDNKIIGGWTFHIGRAYKGYATHKGFKRYPGQLLRNFGN